MMHPKTCTKPMQQQIQYCTTPDGIRLAYAIISKGTPIVRASHWFNNLEYDLKSPVYRHIILGLAHHHSLLRYDARSNGLSNAKYPKFLSICGSATSRRLWIGLAWTDLR